MNNKPEPLSHEELKKLRKPIKNTYVEHKETLTRLDRSAVWITEKVGSMGFFLIIFAWTIAWLGWNTIVSKELRFDPFPAFVLWLFISNMLQLFLMPLIMIGQNHQGRHSEARAEYDLEINVKAEMEIEAILLHLESQNELILKILSKIELEKGK